MNQNRILLTKSRIQDWGLDFSDDFIIENITDSSPVAFSELEIGDKFLYMNGKDLKKMRMEEFLELIENSDFLDVIYKPKESDSSYFNDSEIIDMTQEVNPIEIINRNVSNHNVNSNNIDSSIPEPIVIDLISDDENEGSNQISNDHGNFIDDSDESQSFQNISEIDLFNRLFGNGNARENATSNFHSPVRFRHDNNGAYLSNQPNAITQNLSSDPSSPPIKRQRLNSAAKVKIKVEFEPKKFGEADIEGEVIEIPLESKDNLNESINYPQSKSIHSMDSNNLYELNSNDDEIEFIGGNIQVASDMPHQREACTKFSFIHDTMQQNSKNAEHCPFCYCYVCDIKASECSEWPSHCNASYKSKYWKTERKARTSSILVKMDPSSRSIFFKVFKPILSKSLVFMKPSASNHINLNFSLKNDNQLVYFDRDFKKLTAHYDFTKVPKSHEESIYMTNVLIFIIQTLNLVISTESFNPRNEEIKESQKQKLLEASELLCRLMIKHSFGSYFESTLIKTLFRLFTIPYFTKEIRKAMSSELSNNSPTLNFNPSIYSTIFNYPDPFFEFFQPSFIEKAKSSGYYLPMDILKLSSKNIQILIDELIDQNLITHVEKLMIQVDVNLKASILGKLIDSEENQFHMIAWNVIQSLSKSSFPKLSLNHPKSFLSFFIYVINLTFEKSEKNNSLTFDISVIDSLLSSSLLILSLPGYLEIDYNHALSIFDKILARLDLEKLPIPSLFDILGALDIEDENNKLVIIVVFIFLLVSYLKLTMPNKCHLDSNEELNKFVFRVGDIFKSESKSYSVFRLFFILVSFINDRDLLGNQCVGNSIFTISSKTSQELIKYSIYNLPLSFSSHYSLTEYVDRLHSFPLFYRISKRDYLDNTMLESMDSTSEINNTNEKGNDKGKERVMKYFVLISAKNITLAKNDGSRKFYCYPVFRNLFISKIQLGSQLIDQSHEAYNNLGGFLDINQTLLMLSNKSYFLSNVLSGNILEIRDNLNRYRFLWKSIMINVLPMLYEQGLEPTGRINYLRSIISKLQSFIRVNEYQIQNIFEQYVKSYGLESIGLYYSFELIRSLHVLYDPSIKNKIMQLIELKKKVIPAFSHLDDLLHMTYKYFLLEDYPEDPLQAEPTLSLEYELKGKTYGKKLWNSIFSSLVDHLIEDKATSSSALFLKFIILEKWEPALAVFDYAPIESKLKCFSDFLSTDIRTFNSIMYENERGFSQVLQWITKIAIEDERFLDIFIKKCHEGFICEIVPSLSEEMLRIGAIKFVPEFVIHIHSMNKTQSTFDFLTNVELPNQQFEFLNFLPQPVQDMLLSLSRRTSEEPFHSSQENPTNMFLYNEVRNSLKVNAFSYFHEMTQSPVLIAANLSRIMDLISSCGILYLFETMIRQIDSLRGFHLPGQSSRIDTELSKVISKLIHSIDLDEISEFFIMRFEPLLAELLESSDRSEFFKQSFNLSPPRSTYDADSVSLIWRSLLNFYIYFDSSSLSIFLANIERNKSNLNASIDQVNNKKAHQSMLQKARLFIERKTQHDLKTSFNSSHVLKNQIELLSIFMDKTEFIEYLDSLDLSLINLDFFESVIKKYSQDIDVLPLILCLVSQKILFLNYRIVGDLNFLEPLLEADMNLLSQLNLENLEFLKKYALRPEESVHFLRIILSSKYEAEEEYAALKPSSHFTKIKEKIIYHLVDPSDPIQSIPAVTNLREFHYIQNFASQMLQKTTVSASDNLLLFKFIEKISQSIKTRLLLPPGSDLELATEDDFKDEFLSNPDCYLRILVNVLVQIVDYSLILIKKSSLSLGHNSISTYIDGLIHNISECTMFDRFIISYFNLIKDFSDSSLLQFLEIAANKHETIPSSPDKISNSQQKGVDCGNFIFFGLQLILRNSTSYIVIFSKIACLLKVYSENALKYPVSRFFTQFPLSLIIFEMLNMPCFLAEKMSCDVISLTYFENGIFSFPSSGLWHREIHSLIKVYRSAAAEALEFSILMYLNQIQIFKFVFFKDPLDLSEIEDAPRKPVHSKSANKSRNKSLKTEPDLSKLYIKNLDQISSRKLESLSSPLYPDHQANQKYREAIKLLEIFLTTVPNDIYYFPLLLNLTRSFSHSDVQAIINVGINQSKYTDLCLLLLRQWILLSIYQIGNIISILNILTVKYEFQNREMKSLFEDKTDAIIGNILTKNRLCFEIVPTSEQDINLLAEAFLNYPQIKTFLLENIKIFHPNKALYTTKVLFKVIQLNSSSSEELIDLIQTINKSFVEYLKSNRVKKEIRDQAVSYFGFLKTSLQDYYDTDRNIDGPQFWETLLLNALQSLSSKNALVKLLKSL